MDQLHVAWVLVTQPFPAFLIILAAFACILSRR